MDDALNPLSNVIGYLRPKINDLSMPSLSANHSLRNLTPATRIRCSFYTDSTRDCRLGIVVNSTTSYQIWNLGSMECQSQYRDVCEQFLVTSADACSTPGCSSDQLHDPQTNKCQSIAGLPNGTITLIHFSKIKAEVYKNEALRWPGVGLCEYISSCKAAQLGLIPEHRLQCYCDDLCYYYNDCCEDAPPPPSNATPLPAGTYRSVWLIS